MEEINEKIINYDNYNDIDNNNDDDKNVGNDNNDDGYDDEDDDDTGIKVLPSNYAKVLFPVTR